MNIPRYHFKIVDIDAVWFEAVLAVHIAVLFLIFLADLSAFLSNIDAWFWGVAIYSAVILLLGILLNYKLTLTAPILKHQGSTMVFLYPQEYKNCKFDQEKVSKVFVNPQLFYFAFRQSGSSKTFIFEYSIEERYFDDMLAYLRFALPKAEFILE